MAEESRPSELLTQATDVLASGVPGTVHVTVAGREVGTDPLVEWLQQAARTYALYDGRGWPAARVDERVSRADRAALRFARLLLDASPQADTRPQSRDNAGQAPPALGTQDAE